ncbi:MAG: HTH domain-containing protein [Bacteroidales bacterium]
MGYIEYHERLDYLLKLIKKDMVRSPKECAEKFNCSEKTIRNMINVLRSKGHKIYYNRYAKKYMLK